ncbi:hypothetical protein AX16_009355 [Volvariella volvacea WC 439]|nr:hypothetical protein AX16_009355 [Volvariella volvacea WC 439]
MSSNASMNTRTRLEIDEEISRLEAQIVQLRVRRNALAPIMQVPIEVLQKIMVEYTSAVGSVRWQRITHVSHHIREIALHSPLLWTSINCSTMSATLVGEVLSRSSSAPLTVWIADPKDINIAHPDSVIPLVMAEVHRISDLAISGLSRTWGPDHGVDFSKAPLRRLRLLRCGTFHQDWKKYPDLKRLHIVRSCFNAALISQTLISLTIEEPTPGTLPPKSTFYNILVSLVSLRQLEICRLLTAMAKRTEVSTDSSPDVVRLPSLRRLRAVEGLEECIDLLSRVSSSHLSDFVIGADSKSLTSLSLLANLVIKFAPPCCSPESCFTIRLTTFRKLQKDRRAGLNLYNHKGLVLSLFWLVPNDKETSLNDVLSALSHLSGLKSLELYTLSLHNQILNAVPPCSCTQEIYTDSSDGPRRQDIPLLACSTCCESTASFYPGLRILKVATPNIEAFNLHALTRYIAYRSACGQPLERVVVTINGERTPEKQLVLDQIRLIGGVVRIEDTDT